MRIVIDTNCNYDIFLLALTATEIGRTESTHGMYDLNKGTHFIVDENHDVSQYKEDEDGKES